MELQSGLPFGSATFVGRERERETVADSVAAVRVVTLTGPGGSGKTRLAAAVVGDVAARFSDGACWADLQGVTTSSTVAAAVAGAVGVRERLGEPLVDALVEQLHQRHVLLVLDNCEHVVEACAELVADMSPRCPQLHVLATSRVPLAVTGETTLGLGPLPVPDIDARSAQAVAAAAAARLFELRARQVCSEFRIDDENAWSVAEICRRLDGMPLAIELAAARVRVLAPGQIAAALSDRFRLLTGGVRGAPARQRTLEASLDWSYDLLAGPERLALARLSVFAGSFELDAAKAVVGGGDIDGEEVLDLLAGLIDQSLVQVTQHQDRARYRLLETIRIYGRQRLSELDDPVQIRSRHLEFHVSLAERAHLGLTGGRPEPWVARLTTDLDDLRAAMEHAVEVGDLRALVDLVEPIVRFWFDRGLTSEVHRRLHDAAGAAGTSADQRVRALIAAAGLALASSRPASAYGSASKAVGAARAADVDGALAVALGQRALTGVLSGRASAGQVDDDVELSLHHARRSGEAATHAYVLAFAGGALLHSRSIDAADRLFTRAVEVCEDNDLTFQLPAAYAGPAVWSVWSGRLDRSRRRARRAVELSRQVGRPMWESAGLTALGAAAVLEGDHGRARRWLSEAQAVSRAQAPEATLHGMWLRHWLALLAYVSGDLDTARVTASQIVRIGRGGGSRWDEAIGTWLLGVLAHAQDRRDDARAHLEASRALSSHPRLAWPLGRASLALAALAEQDGELDTAWELAHEGLEALDDYGDRVGSAAALETIARLAAACGESERSLRLLAASQRFHTDTGVARFPLQDVRFEGACSAARTSMNAAAASACWDAGAVLPLSGAVAYARRGRGERARPPIGWASLTPVEREVVRLVAQGHTNAAIGRRLFMSVNTVKKHLIHVYAKVDVDGRAELAAQVVRRDV